MNCNNAVFRVGMCVCIFYACVCVCVWVCDGIIFDLQKQYWSLFMSNLLFVVLTIYIRFVFCMPFVYYLWFKNIVKVCQFSLSPANWICVCTLFYWSATLVVREHRPNHQQSTLRSTACPWTPHAKNWNSAPLHHPRLYPLLTAGVTWSSPLPRQSWHLHPTRRGAAPSKNPVNRL